MGLTAGEWVEVRSKEEILRSLDSDGRLENLPFMPQMFDYCGKRFQVYKSAHKTCDTINGTGGRSLPRSVHLTDLRCTGEDHGGCQAACLLFWKEAWLKPVDDTATSSVHATPSLAARASGAICSEQVVRSRVLAKDQPASGERVYSCHATELPNFTSKLYWWDARQYIEDYTSGNISLRRLLEGFLYAVYYYLARPGRRNPIRKPFQWFYDQVMKLRGGTPFPRRGGTIPFNLPTPSVQLNLQPGDHVRVKSYQEIRATTDLNSKNRGLFFDAEMVPYCGRTFQVRTRVSRFINEKTGRLVTLKTPAVILENVWCQSRYSERRMNCPRSIYSWWREVWLERISDDALSSDQDAPVRHPTCVTAALTAATQDS